MKSQLFLAALSLVLLISGSAVADPVILKPLFTSTPPVIDGVLDDPVWSAAPMVSGFATFSPDFGKRIPEQTEVRMAYDRENLYFAYRCIDQQPDKIRMSMTSRDNIINDDWVCLNLDSFNDRQGLFALYVNPLGIQADSRFAAGNEDFSIDLIWYSAGVVTPDGYSVEYRIPLKSLRYDDADTVMMSVFFERYISRRAEHSSFPNLDPAKGDAFMTQMAPMAYPGVKHYTLLELLPDFTVSRRYARQQGKLTNTDNSTDLGFTVKYGLTSKLIFDGTVNPDFSQVEADAGQIDVNLRSALFLTEKRPFFLEGKDNFTFGATGITERDPFTEIIHTRSIEDPVAGARLTGKIAGNDQTIASIAALDRVPEERRTADEQYAWFPIVRYKHALSDDSYIGGIAAGRFTSREWNSRFLRSNTIAGIDDQIRTGESSMMEGSFVLSTLRPDPGSAVETGHTIGFRYRSATRNFDYDWGIRSVSENFTTDMGYIGRTGLTTLSGLLRPKFYPASLPVQRMDAEFFSAQSNDHPSGMWETFNHASLLFFLNGSMNFKVKYSYSTEIYRDRRFKTGGYHAALSGQLVREAIISLLYRRIQSIDYSETPSQGRTNLITASVKYLPSDRLQAEASFLFYDFRRESDDQMLYREPISRLKLTWQHTRNLFARAIGEYNNSRKSLTTDFLLSFTTIPGTVVFLGYGSLYGKYETDGLTTIEHGGLVEKNRGLFAKASYLWRV